MNSLSLNNQGISNLQKYLRTLSFFDQYRTIPQIAIDGIYGKETRNAITAYQKIKKLTQTGTTDKQTYNSLYKDYRKILNYKKSMSPSFNFPSYPRKFEFQKGYRGFYAYFLKHLLNELRKDRDTYEELQLDDIYDENLANAVKKVQKTYQIPETGDVDAVTWNNIIKEYNKNQTNKLE